MEIAILKAKLAIYEQKRLKDAKEIGRLKNEALWWEAYASKYHWALSCELSEKLTEEVKQEMFDKGITTIVAVPAAPPASPS